jgi:hypothetical protein
MNFFNGTQVKKTLLPCVYLTLPLPPWSSSVTSHRRYPPACRRIEADSATKQGKNLAWRCRGGHGAAEQLQAAGVQVRGGGGWVRSWPPRPPVALGGDTGKAPLWRLGPASERSRSAAVQDGHGGASASGGHPRRRILS